MIGNNKWVIVGTLKNAPFAHCGHNRMFWYDFPSLCSCSAVIENSPRGCLSFPSISIYQDEFYQQLQAIRQPWHIPSDTDSDIMEPPEQDKSELAVTCFLLSLFLPPRRLSFFIIPAAPYCGALWCRSTENIPVPVELGDVRLRERQPNYSIQKGGKNPQSNKENKQTIEMFPGDDRAANTARKTLVATVWRSLSSVNSWSCPASVPPLEVTMITREPPSAFSVVPPTKWLAISLSSKPLIDSTAFPATCPNHLTCKPQLQLSVSHVNWPDAQQWLCTVFTALWRVGGFHGRPPRWCPISHTVMPQTRRHR